LDKHENKLYASVAPFVLSLSVTGYCSDTC